MGIDYTKRPSSSGGDANQSPPATPPPAAGWPPPAAPPAPAGPVNLGKVTLTKSAPSVSLTKSGAAGGELRVNLNWNARPAQQSGGGGGGFFKRMAAATQGGGSIDLDLGCLYEFTDGSKGVVQALGRSFTSRNAGTPIITLDGDDRSGTNSGGENLRIDLNRLAEIRRIIVFAFIYEGVPNWAAADGVVTLFPAVGGPIEVRLDEADPRAPLCAIALLTNSGNDLTVNREVRYIHGGQDVLDQAYGWGMKWGAGRK
ncbi:TerD family protein [Trujillonella endophytica]|uniref:Tellurite resistance protein TerA n=1 Tax=Trujillonella endophytica TaxID=673521 RepID=A0A1H8PIV0_9ACTN|nr:tellurium resistance protein [Trujillella endophytica]SEO41598.1 tellurite resistance protein TerA [Trujillella endophytica]